MRGVLVLLAGALLGGCVGPNFHRPPPPDGARFTAAPLPTQTAAADGALGDAQRFLDDLDVPRDWWRLFGSPALDALVNEALHGSPQVASAQAALRQARENTAAQRAAYWPSAQAGFDAQRNRDATGVLQPTLESGAPIYNLFTPQLSVGFVPDLFGGNHRQVESLAAKAEAARDQLDATYLTLTANVVTSAVQEATLRAQIAATERLIAIGRESLEVMQKQLALGAIAQADVYAQQALLAQLESTLPPLDKQRWAARDALALLTGRLPGAYDAAPFELTDLKLPVDLPLGLPSQLVSRRPDVRAAEAQLHAATADVGVAIANMLPQIQLTANVGSTAATLGTLFNAGTNFWGLEGQVTQPLFAGGSLLHKKRAAQAALDQATADYKSAVLTAFQDVADALHALQADADALAAAARAERAADNSLQVARAQLKVGASGYLALLVAEQGYQQAVVGGMQARGNRLEDTAALFQALGGSIAP